MLFCRVLSFFVVFFRFFKIIFFEKFFFSGIPSEYQTVWIQIRPDVLLRLIWVQTFCKDYQQTHAGKYCMLFCRLLIFFFSSKYLFQKVFFSRIPPECQTVRIQIRPNVLLGLIWVQTDCKGYQQTHAG